MAMAHLRLPSCLRPRARSGLNDMEEKNCAIDFCPRARGGYKRICILDRFKIVSVRLRRAGLQGACVEMVIALPSARAGAVALCRYVLRRRFRPPARESAARAAGRKFRAKTHLPKVHDRARVSRVSEGRWRLNRFGVK